MTLVMWIYRREDGRFFTLAEQNVPDGRDGGLVKFAVDADVARRWAEELRSGQVPSDDDSGGLGLPSESPHASAG